MQLSRVLIAATMMVSVSAIAATPVIDERQANQQKRINQGVASGQLTGKEAANLQRGQARVSNMKANAKADGVVTKSERAHIKHAQKVQSNRIYNKKHD